MHMKQGRRSGRVVVTMTAQEWDEFIKLLKKVGIAVILD